MQSFDFVNLHAQKLGAKITEISGEEISKLFSREEELETEARISLQQIFRNLTIESITKEITFFVTIDNIDFLLSKEFNSDPIIKKSRQWLFEEIQKIVKASYSDSEKRPRIMVFFYCNNPKNLDSFWTRSIIQKAIFLDFQTLQGIKVSVAASVKAFEKSFSLYKSAAEWVDSNSNETFVYSNRDSEASKPVEDEGWILLLQREFQVPAFFGFQYENSQKSIS